jgi:hypothetical protein
MTRIDVNDLAGLEVSLGHKSILERLPRGEYIVRVAGECTALGGNGSRVCWLSGTVIAPEAFAGRSVTFILSEHAITTYPNLTLTTITEQEH